MAAPNKLKLIYKNESKFFTARNSNGPGRGVGGVYLGGRVGYTRG